MRSCGALSEGLSGQSWEDLGGKGVLIDDDNLSSKTKGSAGI